MNWEAIGAIGEVIGALAVVLTLIYLARQIAVQNRSTQISLIENIVQGFNDANKLLASDAYLAKLFERGMTDPDDLSDEESAQCAWLFRVYMNLFSKAWEYHRRGVVDSEMYNTLMIQGAVLAQSKGGQRWLANESDFQPEFQKEVLSRKLSDKGLALSLKPLNQSVSNAPPNKSLETDA